jgi:hypothetical protein
MKDKPAATKLGISFALRAYWNQLQSQGTSSDYGLDESNLAKGQFNCYFLLYDVNTFIAISLNLINGSPDCDTEMTQQ